MNHLSEKTAKTQFANDVLKGLRSTPKHISSKYFYDSAGSEIFRQIMRMPEYYLTDCEYEIFDRQADAIQQAFTKGTDAFRLIEFGAGDGLKTKILLKHFLEQKLSFKYTPIDISGSALNNLAKDLSGELPDLKVSPVKGEYFEALHTLYGDSSERKIVLFLGSNIGNFTEKEAIHFLNKLSNELNKGDLAFIGFDLKKDPDIILSAYNDPAGITREFNLNLLRRMNRELGANFDLDNFRHYPTYDPITGETKSYLLSTKSQLVHFADLDEAINFDAWEAIWLELSQKYDRHMIKKYAAESGFRVVRLFTDSRGYFVNALWEKI